MVLKINNKKIYISFNFPYLDWDEIKLFSTKILTKTTLSHTNLNKENNSILCEVK